MSTLRTMAASFALLLAVGGTVAAHAEIIVELTDGASDAPVFASSTASQYQFNGTIGGFTVGDFISSFTSTNPNNFLSQGASFSANGAGSTTLTVTETNLTSASQVIDFASQFGGATGNSSNVSISRTTCFDPGNGPKAVGMNEPCFNMIGSDGTLSAAAASVAEIVGNSPFSISEDITFTAFASTLPSASAAGAGAGPTSDGTNGGTGNPDGTPGVGGADAGSPGQVTSVSDAVTIVPEPMSLALVIPGLIAFGMIRRRRNSDGVGPQGAVS
jgi:hypothetical protein